MVDKSDCLDSSHGLRPSNDAKIISHDIGIVKIEYLYSQVESHYAPGDMGGLGTGWHEPGADIPALFGEVENVAGITEGKRFQRLSVAGPDSHVDKVAHGLSAVAEVEVGQHDVLMVASGVVAVQGAQFGVAAAVVAGASHVTFSSCHRASYQLMPSGNRIPSGRRMRLPGRMSRIRCRRVSFIAR